MQALKLKERRSLAAEKPITKRTILDPCEWTPLQMEWQLTIVDPIDFRRQTRARFMPSDRPQGLKPVPLKHGVTTLFPSPVATNTDTKLSTAHIRTDGIMQTLTAYTAYNYTKYSCVVLRGFLHEIQRHEALIIPKDIRDICFQFYFEEETKYFQFAYTLYHSLTVTKSDILGGFSGKELVSIIKRNLCDELLQHRFTEDITAICTTLLRYDIIETMSFQTNFLSLFRESEQDASFHSSANYTYNFVKCKIDAFKAMYFN